MTRIRAKFKCVEDTRSAYNTGRRLKLSAVYAAFEVGTDYYVDFTKVDA